MRRLLDAAMEVFSQRGYHAARVDDIVRAANTSHGTFYLYFANKEDLLRALAAEAGEVVAALDAGLGPVGPDEAGWWELRAWMERFSAAWQRYAPVLRAWTDVVVTDAQLAEQAHLSAGGVMATLADRMVHAGPPPGIDPTAAAEAVIAMVDRFHYLRQFAAEPVDDVALDTLTTIVHRGLFGGGDPPVRRSRARRRSTRAPAPADGGPATGPTEPPTTAAATGSRPTTRAHGTAGPTRRRPTAGSTGPGGPGTPGGTEPGTSRRRAGQPPVGDDDAGTVPAPKRAPRAARASAAARPVR
jgi:AcrR family transcriptional regulator